MTSVQCFQTSAPDLIQMIRCCPNDFTINNNDVSYDCHFVILATHCNLFRRMIVNKKHPSSYIWKTNVPLKHLKNVIDHFYGAPLEINIGNCKELMVIALHLDSPALLEKVSPFEAQMKYLEVTVDIIEDGGSVGDDMYDVVAKYFELLRCYQPFCRLSHDAKMRILGSNTLRLLSEDSLVKWIISREEREPIMHVMNYMNCVRFENVSGRGFNWFLDSGIPMTKDVREAVKQEFVKDPRTRDINLDDDRYWKSQQEFASSIVKEGRARFQRKYSNRFSSYTTTHELGTMSIPSTSAAMSATVEQQAASIVTPVFTQPTTFAVATQMLSQGAYGGTMASVQQIQRNPT